MQSYTLVNDTMTLTVNELGGELVSLRTKDGREWLWQGKAPFWRQTAPHLFPFIGKHTQDCYLHQGVEYPSLLHGFLHKSVLRCTHSARDRLVLSLTATAQTREIYPFDFCFEITYALRDTIVEISYSIANMGNDTMYFSVGGHPGFNIPLAEETLFEDWELVFPHAHAPRRMLISDDCFYTGYSEPYCLAGGTRLPLNHDLFHREAVILAQTGGEVCLQSAKSRKRVLLRYPDMPFLAVWHTPHTQAPFLCLEPWTALPARKDICETLAAQPFLTALAAGKQTRNTWEIAITP